MGAFHLPFLATKKPNKIHNHVLIKSTIVKHRTAQVPKGTTNGKRKEKYSQQKISAHNQQS